MKKGFTLIELLAVIVILAIIALISTPIVLNIIKDSKKLSQLKSARFYVGAVETSIAQATLNNKKLLNGNYNILKNGNICIEYNEDKCINELKIKVNGETPISGKITILDGKINYVKLKYENDKNIGYNEKNELIFLESDPYKESENIEIPNLYNNTLTPVIYDGDNWRVADVTDKWYDYSKQEWANAVILDSNVKKEVGDPITVDGTNPDVLAMFVWIPRYEYKIEGTYGKGGINASIPGEIEINFIKKDTNEPTENYIIHPAFNFGGNHISGIWVGKFELSHKTKIYSLNCTTETCSESEGIRILPNVQSLRNNKVSSFFYAIRSMSKDKNVFGIDSNILDTHMIKNSEWGAVAYLSQSRYGKYGNNNYEGTNKEVYINNSSNMITGRSGGSYGGNTAVNTVYTDHPNENTLYSSFGYYTYDGYLLEYNTNKKLKKRDMKTIASTTGNIYGIYDMSGGAWDYAFGVFENSDGEKWSGNSSNSNSGFAGKVGTLGDNITGLEWPEQKYYEVYKAKNGTSINLTTACNNEICYGHALSETQKWYGDYVAMVSPSGSWFMRGDYYGSVSAGVFSAAANDGSAYGSRSTRVVIVPII